MKSTSKKLVALTLTAIMSAGLFQSCVGTDNNEQVAILQRQLDSTMQQYEKLKSQGGDFEQELSSRDSAITAQAAEIQRLINELSAAKRRSNTASASDENTRIEQQQKEIREKENTIRQLQRQIEKQSKQIAELDKKNQSGTQNTGDQQKQLTKLQDKIDEQQRQIASLQSDVKRLRTENSSANSSSDKLKKDYEAQLSDVNKQLSSCRSELSQLNAQLSAKDAEIKRLSDKGASAPDNSAELKQLRAQVRDLNEKEAACRKQYDELVASTTQSSSRDDADKKALQNQIDNLNTQVQTLQGRVNQLQTQNAQLQSQNGQSQTENSAETTRMQKTIDDLNAQVEQQRAQVAKLQSDLQKKDQELAEAKKAINNKPTANTVSSRLEELQRQCDGYLAEIERLRAENEQLKSQNAELKDRVAGSAELYAENERLQQKVKLASVLVTTDLKVMPGKSIKPGNIVSPTNKAKKTKVIRIDCRILDNNVVDPGSMTIYARIANAANRVVANGQPESFDMAGVQMQYTMKQDIEFTGYGRNLAMIWKINDDVELTPGLYWVSLYAGGYEIGKVSFKLD